MLTDGYVGDEKHIFETVRDHLGSARLFSLGVGSSPNRYLLEGLAEMGRGGGGTGYGSGSGVLRSKAATITSVSATSGGLAGLVGGATGTPDSLGGLRSRGHGPATSGGNLSNSAAGTAPTVRTGQTIVRGALDRSLVERVIQRHLNALRYCYQRELRRDPDLAGEVVITFTIAADSTVQNARVERSTLEDEAVQTCLVSRFSKMRFPQPAGGGLVVVTYPLRFLVQ